MSEFHWTLCLDPICQVVPAFGLSHDGAITTGPGASSAIGDAIVEEARARAKRRAAKGCITEAAEETVTTTQV